MSLNYLLMLIHTWEEKVISFFVHQHSWHRVNQEVLFGYRIGGCIKVHVRLEAVSGAVESLP